MFPLPKTSPVPLYAMQEFKCLVTAMEEMKDPLEGNCMFQLDKKYKVVSYKRDFETEQFSPLVVIRSLIEEVEALQDHIRAREDVLLNQVVYRDTNADARIRALESELNDLKGFCHS
jgi:hypothetical protein